jgi:thiamine pyrophosphate-dependent acetolactate synthase large subunit-like protein
MTRCSTEPACATSWCATSRAPAHAAEGYARSTGKPGVVLVTSGPGATNAVTGITDALMDSIPLVASPARCRRI